jgi:hypothetical protein
MHADNARNREAEKRAFEVEQGRLVAEHLNRTQGTDYVARAASTEPADVTLASTSGRVPVRDAQVVSIPLDFRNRDDKQTVSGIRTRLSLLMRARGIQEIYVGLILSGEAEMHGMTQPRIEQLTDLIVQNRRTVDVTLKYDEIYDAVPELAELVHIIVIGRPGLVCGVEVDIPAGGPVPPDGRWIREGIQHKLTRYGGEEAVRDLTLIIGVAGFVDHEQVAAFQDAFRAANLPFAEIYINTPFHGTTCLKAASH